MNLYNKYRSKNFSEVVGQKHIVSIVSNAILLDRVGHAYLFSGSRGTGKTTLARLLAKSLNCENRKKNEFEPCNKCTSCKEIDLGSSMDIIEIDAASNRGIDEIRALRDKVKFASSGNKYKVFIIDEVHMLTREAFNALLKTLEEPPQKVVFIMATTELHKVPETIISRTQQFDFELHKLPDIVQRLSEIAKKEKIKIDESSLRLISLTAKGGMRDAITLLDQVSNNTKQITIEVVRESLGLSSYEAILRFVKLLYEKDSNKLMEIIEKLSKKGVDFYEFLYEVIEFLRKILLFQMDYKKITDNLTKEESIEIKKIASKYDVMTTYKIIEKLVKIHNDVKYAIITSLPLELAVFDLCGLKKNDHNKIQDNEVLKNNIDKKKQIVIEHKVKVKSCDISKKIKSANNIDLQKILEKWNEFLKNINSCKTLSIVLENSKPIKYENNALFIALQFGFYKEKLENKKNYKKLCDKFEEFYNLKTEIKFEVDSKLVKKVKENTTKYLNDENQELLNEAEEVFG